MCIFVLMLQILFCTVSVITIQSHYSPDAGAGKDADDDSIDWLGVLFDVDGRICVALLWPVVTLVMDEVVKVRIYLH